MKGIAEEAGPSESAAFVSWVFRERLLRIPSLELCGVSNPTVGHLRWRPFYSPWRCVKPLCRAIFALTVCFDGDSSSPAWNVAGRKMARCQQMWQSLAESLDGAETLPADIKERCRKCLFQAAFQHLLLCSQGDWTTAYKEQAVMWTKPRFSTTWPFFAQFEAEGQLPPTMQKANNCFLLFSQLQYACVRNYILLEFVVGHHI